MKRILFICTENLQRSPTAEDLMNKIKGYEARSAGVSPTAVRRPTSGDIEWADIIFVMEEWHLDSLKEKFGLIGKRVINLDIPDIYLRDSRELKEKLRERLSMHLDLN